MKKTPQLVADALLKAEDKINDAISVFPITIRRYALLELLESPFIDTTKKFTVSSLIPTAYVVCTKNENLKKYNAKTIDELISDAMDWSECLSMNDIPKITEVVSQEFLKLNTAAPEQGANEPVKKN